MSKEEGIPEDIIEEIKLKEPKKEIMRVKIIKEDYQVRFPLPKKLRQEIDFKKYPYSEVEYDEKNKTIIYRLIKNG